METNTRLLFYDPTTINKNKGAVVSAVRAEQIRIGDVDCYQATFTLRSLHLSVHAPYSTDPFFDNARGLRGKIRHPYSETKVRRDQKRYRELLRESPLVLGPLIVVASPGILEFHPINNFEGLSLFETYLLQGLGYLNLEGGEMVALDHYRLPVLQEILHRYWETDFDSVRAQMENVIPVLISEYRNQNWVNSLIKSVHAYGGGGMRGEAEQPWDLR